MKKIIVHGIVAGIVMLIAGMVIGFVFNLIFPAIKMEYANANLFRAWSEPLMSLYFLYPFLLGIALSWVWNKTKSLFTNPVVWKRGKHFGLAYWLFTTIPAMVITYSSFRLSLGMIFVWLVSGLVQTVLGGIILAKLNL